MGADRTAAGVGGRYRDLEARGLGFRGGQDRVHGFRRPGGYDDGLRLVARVGADDAARIEPRLRAVLRRVLWLCEGHDTLACVNPPGQTIPIPEEIGPPAEQRRAPATGGVD